MKSIINSRLDRLEADIFFNGIKPICKLCNREVDNLELFQNFIDQTFIIIANCHNDTDRMEIPIEELPKLLSELSAYGKGIAFYRKLLVEVQDKLLEDKS
jgi:hypothetical protein